jgi:hypothetical protein
LFARPDHIPRKLYRLIRCLFISITLLMRARSGDLLLKGVFFLPVLASPSPPFRCYVLKRVNSNVGTEPPTSRNPKSTSTARNAPQTNAPPPPPAFRPPLLSCNVSSPALNPSWAPFSLLAATSVLRKSSTMKKARNSTSIMIGTRSRSHEEANMDAGSIVLRASLSIWRGSVAVGRHGFRILT